MPVECGGGRVVKTRTKSPTDIAVGGVPHSLVVTPDGKTVFVSNDESVSVINVKSRTKVADITGFRAPTELAITPCQPKARH